MVYIFMSSFKKKEQNLNQLIDKLNSLSLSYSQPNYELEKIRTEKNDLTNNIIKIHNTLYIFSEVWNIIDNNGNKGYYLYDGDKYFISFGENTYYIYELSEQLNIYHINKNEWLTATIEN